MTLTAPAMPQSGTFVSDSWGQITQLSGLQCGRPPQSTLQAAVSAALAGLRAPWAPWEPETNELWWDGLAKRLWTLATLAGQHDREMFSRILVKAGLCVWLLVLALLLCLFQYWSICFPPSSPTLGKEMSHYKDKQANKNPTLVCFHPVLTPTSNWCLQCRGPSKCDTLPALFLPLHLKHPYLCKWIFQAFPCKTAWICRTMWLLQPLGYVGEASVHGWHEE